MRLARGGLAARLFGGGASSVLAGGVTAFVPLVGSVFLAGSDYAVWALISTLATVFIVFDFGAVHAATKLAADGELTGTSFTKLAGATCLAPMAFGLIMMWAWRPYAEFAGLPSTGGVATPWVIALVAAGTSLRSVGALWAGVSLGRGALRSRAVILLSGALTQLVGTTIALAAGAGPVSLGIGLIIGGSVQLVAGLILESSFDEFRRETSDRTSAMIRTFFLSKGLVTVLSLAVTQLDRWALAVVAPVGMFATYDIASRVAIMPKVAMLAFSAGLVTEASRAPSVTAAQNLRRHAQRLVSIAAALSFLMSSSVAAAIVLNRKEVGFEWLGVVALVCLGHAVHSATIGVSTLVTGLGSPSLELRYLFPLALSCCVFYGISIFTGEAWLLVGGWSASMAITSVAFLTRGRRYVNIAYRRASGTVEEASHV